MGTRLFAVFSIAVAFGTPGCDEAAPRAAPKGDEVGATPPNSGAIEGADFVREARILYRVAACGTSGDLPPRFDALAVARHCDELLHVYDEYRRTFLDLARPFFHTIRPSRLPAAVVYPFGGGDLATALAVFPDAREITTISLEPSGDVRSADGLAPDRLRHELSLHRSRLERLFDWGYSRTDNLWDESHARWPGEVVFALAALVLDGDEPISLKYFRLAADGSMQYVTADEVANTAPEERPRLFTDLELAFRKAEEPGAPIRLFRHISMDLSNRRLNESPALLAHLESKGPVSAMTKAASHLLWRDDFSRFREWLLARVVWMVSDSTGPPPRFARDAGLVQDAYGRYEGRPWGLAEDRDGADLARLFSSASSPRSADLGFPFGYPDKNGNADAIVTRRP